MYVNGISAGNPAAAPGAAAKAESGADFGSVLSGTMGGAVNLDEIFNRASGKYGVPVNLLKAVAKAESNFSPDAKSPCGAMGIMQLMPGTAKSLGVSDPYDPEQSIMGGAKYLGNLLSQFDGDPQLAVAAYNAGPGNVKKYSGVPPFSETQNYVSRVMGYCGDNISPGLVSGGACAASQGGEAASSSPCAGDALSALLQLEFCRIQMELFDGAESGLLSGNGDRGLM